MDRRPLDVDARQVLENKGTSLGLLPSNAVERIFALRFRDYFDIYPSREAAIPE